MCVLLTWSVIGAFSSAYLELEFGKLVGIFSVRCFTELEVSLYQGMHEGKGIRTGFEGDRNQQHPSSIDIC